MHLFLTLHFISNPQRLEETSLLFCRTSNVPHLPQCMGPQPEVRGPHTHTHQGSNDQFQVENHSPLSQMCIFLEKISIAFSHSHRYPHRDTRWKPVLLTYRYIPSHRTCQCRLGFPWLSILKGCQKVQLSESGPALMWPRPQLRSQATLPWAPWPSLWLGLWPTLQRQKKLCSQPCFLGDLAQPPCWPHPAELICSWCCPAAWNSLLFRHLGLAGAAAPCLIPLSQVRRANKLTSLVPAWHLLANVSIHSLFSMIPIWCYYCISIHPKMHNRTIKRLYLYLVSVMDFTWFLGF